MNDNEIVGVHRFADAFPMLPDFELEELADSIRANGLRNPIVITLDGLLLDGRNRREACTRAGITPTTVVYEGDDLAEYVIDSNVTRRNLSTGARAMATALVLQADGRRTDNGRWKRGSVDNIETNISGQAWKDRLKEAGVILDFKPDLAEQVTSGVLALDAAYQQAKAIRDSAERDKIMAREKAKRARDEAEAEAEANAKIIADLTMAEATKFLDLINDGTMAPRTAWAAHREETRKEREAEQVERDANNSYFAGISRAIRVAASSAGHVDERMRKYNPDDLDELTKSQFTAEQIDALVQFANEMKAWVSK